MEILKVSAQSDASATAGALANTIRESGEAELQGIGPKAINQAVKAIAIARSYLASSGVDLVSMPSFVDVEIDGEQRTALRFTITPRHRLHQSHVDGPPMDGTGEAEEREESTGADREPESEPDGREAAEPAEAAPSRRPTSLSEAITGRPASELTDDDADATSERESPETSEGTGDDADRSEQDDTERRSSFWGRARRSAFDTDRDVF
jgi:stage V sporulation protein S